MKPQKKTIRAVVEYLEEIGLSIYGDAIDLDTGIRFAAQMDYDIESIEKYIALLKRDPDAPHDPEHP